MTFVSTHRTISTCSPEAESMGAYNALLDTKNRPRPGSQSFHQGTILAASSLIAAFQSSPKETKAPQSICNTVKTVRSSADFFQSLDFL